jgi:transcriptional regulator with XRE-family HTH domain
MDATTTLGNRLREERKRLGLLQPAFADLGGVKRVTQHFYEQDERVPDANYLLRLHEHGIDVVYVLLGKRQRLDGVALAINVLGDIYRAVEELARDDMGEPLSIAERVRLFSMLAIAQSESSSPPAAEALHKRLLLCLSAAA